MGKKKAIGIAENRWQKVLYKRQPFPDNYTDENLFLDQLRTNVDVVRYSMLEAVRGAATVMSQTNLVVLYLVIFQLVQEEQLGVGTLLCTNFILATFSFCLFVGLEGFGNGKKKWLFHGEHLRTLITVIAFGYAFTPIIRTLTTSISTDSIWASAILLFLFSLIVHDYGLEGAPIASGPLSANLCLAASVFLISRLASDQLAFLLLALSLLLFCFWPTLRNALLARAPNAVFLLLPPLGFCSLVVLLQLDDGIAFVGMHCVLHIFLLAFCPWLLLRMQRLKSTIHGPWDEATFRASIH